MFLLSILYFIYVTFSICFYPFLYVYTYYVYCHAPAYQDKFLVCENILGNKPDSEVVITCAGFHEMKCGNSPHLKWDYSQSPDTQKSVTSVQMNITAKNLCLHLRDRFPPSPFQNKPFDQWLVSSVVTSSAAISQSTHSWLSHKPEPTRVRKIKARFHTLTA